MRSRRTYFASERPAAIAANEALTAIDPAELSDDDLARHLEACEAHAIAGYQRHFELHATDMFPVGLYLAACREFGIDAAVALDLVVDGIADVRGASEHVPGFDQCIVGGYDLDRPRLCECTAATAAIAEVDRLDAPTFTNRHARFDDLVPGRRARAVRHPPGGCTNRAPGARRQRTGLRRVAHRVAAPRLPRGAGAPRRRSGLRGHGARARRGARRTGRCST